LSARPPALRTKNYFPAEAITPGRTAPAVARGSPKLLAFPSPPRCSASAAGLRSRGETALRNRDDNTRTAACATYGEQARMIRSLRKSSGMARRNLRRHRHSAAGLATRFWRSTGPFVVNGESPPAQTLNFCRVRLQHLRDTRMQTDFAPRANVAAVQGRYASSTASRRGRRSVVTFAGVRHFCPVSWPIQRSETRKLACQRALRGIRLMKGV